jgi:hypothetical protein
MGGSGGGGSDFESAAASPGTARRTGGTGNAGGEVCACAATEARIVTSANKQPGWSMLAGKAGLASRQAQPAGTCDARTGCRTSARPRRQNSPARSIAARGGVARWHGLPRLVSCQWCWMRSSRFRLSPNRELPVPAVADAARGRCSSIPRAARGCWRG